MIFTLSLLLLAFCAGVLGYCLGIAAAIEAERKKGRKP